MKKAELEKWMLSMTKVKPITDEQLVMYVMNAATSRKDTKEKIKDILEMLLLAARSRMDNLRSMRNGYKGGLRSNYANNIYLLMNILTSSQPIRKKLIVAIAFVNTLLEREL